MHFEAEAPLRDIEHHINLATQFVAGLNYEEFQTDTRTVYAVIRCLEIISEARPIRREYGRIPTIRNRD
jgi:uncharacterized protein with HEPN domain